MNPTATNTMRAITNRDALAYARDVPAQNYDTGLREALARRFPVADVRVRTGPDNRTRVSWGPAEHRREVFVPVGTKPEFVGVAMLANYASGMRAIKA